MVCVCEGRLVGAQPSLDPNICSFKVRILGGSIPKTAHCAEETRRTARRTVGAVHGTCETSSLTCRGQRSRGCGGLDRAVLAEQGPRELMGDKKRPVPVTAEAADRRCTVKSHQTTRFERVNFTAYKLYLKLKHS